MKKNFGFIAATLMALAATMPVMANETLTVCDGTATSAYLPLQNTYFDTPGSHSQMIYPASELTAMTGQVINSMVFYATDELNMSGGSLVISLGESESDVYESASYVAGLTQVAAIELTAGVTELVVNFDTPFNYAGGNLVVDLNVAAAGDISYSWNYFYGMSQDGYTAITRSGSRESFLPKVTFDFGVPADYAARVTPAEVVFNTIRAEREDVQTVVLTNTGLNAFTPAFGTLNAPFSIDVEAAELAAGESLEIPVKFAPAEAGEFTAVLSIDCGEAGVVEVALTAAAIEAANELVVCDGTLTNYYVPVYGLYYDTEGTMGQMIYPAEMLADMAGTKLTSLTFHVNKALDMYNGNIQLSLKEVEAAAFAEATAIADMTVVANAAPVQGETEITFTFNEPFEYNGGNLAVECMVTETGKYSSTYFYGVSTEGNSSLYAYNSWGSMSASLQSFLPKATFTFKKEEAPQPQFALGDVNHDGKVDVSDVTMLISHILGAQIEGFYIEQANVNGDEAGTIDVSDVTAMISMILGNN